MKYLIIGGGATGGCLGALMTEGGLDVTILERGETLKAIQDNGITIDTEFRGMYNVKPVKACSSGEYCDDPDVVFICVKEPAVKHIIPFLREKISPDTIVIPFINVFAIGMKLQGFVPELNVLDGFNYLVANCVNPGVIRVYGNLFSIVFGTREQDSYTWIIDKISFDLRSCGIEAEVSDDILCDSMRKFSFVSPVTVCGLHFNCTYSKMQRPGPEREFLVKLMEEIELLANAMGYNFSGDIIEGNLELVDRIEPTAVTAVQRDIQEGQRSEIDGILHKVVRMGKHCGIELPNYEMVAAEFSDSVESW